MITPRLPIWFGLAVGAGAVSGCIGLIDTGRFDLEAVSPRQIGLEAERTAAFASRWAEFDRDGDNSLGRDEWRDRQWAFHLIFDSDQNQRLNLSEYVRSVCGPSDRLPELFRICSQREIRTFVLLTAEADGTAEMSPGEISSRSDTWFRMNDLDRDGRVSRSEHLR